MVAVKTHKTNIYKTGACIYSQWCNDSIAKQTHEATGKEGDQVVRKKEIYKQKWAQQASRTAGDRWKQ